MATILPITNIKTNNDQDICRTCLTKVNKNSYNIFEEHKNGKLIADLLRDYIFLTIEKDDGFPLKICDNCLVKLYLIFDFRLMAIESSEKLQKSHTNFFNVDSESLDIKEEKPVVTIGIETANTNVNEIKVESTKNKEITVNCELDEIKQEIIESNIEIACVMKEEEIENNSLDICNPDKYKETQLVEISNKVNIENEEIDFDEDSIDEGLLKYVDVSEYEHLKNSLTSYEKKKVKLLCKLCNKSISFYHFFGEHLPQHLGKVPYKCDICDKGFARDFNLKQHRAQHTDTRSYICNVCGKSFKTNTTLIQHKQVHSICSFECDICHKKFKSNSNLRQHLRIHKAEKRYTCEICGKSYVDCTGLYRHTIGHHTDSKFICSTCGKAFKTKDVLQQHKKRHTDYKPFTCSYCDKCFRDRSMLKRHTNIHTGAKPYSCKICGKSFRQSSCVGRHMRIHTGETPFLCGICPEKFKYSQQLLKHLSKHHQ